MMKFSLLISVVFVLFHSGNSAPEVSNFGTFFGGCPEVKYKLVDLRLFQDIEGEWYTHRVLNNYTPWKHLRCQSSIFDFKSDGPSTVTTRFSVPGVPFSFQVDGKVKRVNGGEYTLTHQTIFGEISQKTAILSVFNAKRGAIVWTCVDFKYFHIENIQVIMQYKVSSTNAQHRGPIASADQAVINYGLSRDALIEIDQSSC